MTIDVDGPVSNKKTKPNGQGRIAGEGHMCKGGWFLG
jgi:hypothetical protein